MKAAALLLAAALLASQAAWSSSVYWGATIEETSTACPTGAAAEPCFVRLVLIGDKVVICQFPFLDDDLCADFAIDDCVNAKGLYGVHDGEAVLYATSVRHCA